MDSREITPDVITYNTLISAFSNCQQTDRAIELFQKMQVQRIIPDVITFNALFAACEQSAEWEKALDLFSEMKRKKVQPDVISFNSLISACANTPSSTNYSLQAQKLLKIIGKN